MKLNVFFISLFFLVACGAPDYKVERHLKEPTDQVRFLRSTLPYYAKLPDGFGPDRRFDTVLNKLYNQILPSYQLEAYHIDDETGMHFFMVSRPAPSLHQKRICIAGKLKYDPSGNFEYYEEVFWTFKMKEAQLREKSIKLFHLMVKGEDLSKFYPQNSQEEWIEYPDEKNRYDVDQRRWVFGSQK